MAAGADALAMAGGDGSQAIVAEIAAGEGLPYACIPAGTRNHFALDLGVDRDDVVGGLDALVDGRRAAGRPGGGERAGVRQQRLPRALRRGGPAGGIPRREVEDPPGGARRAGLGADPDAPSMRWRGADGSRARGAVALLVSNDAYRLGTVIGSGTRPRLDEGVLGIATLTAEHRQGAAPTGLALAQWRTPTFTVEADGPMAAGIDGEAVTLQPPVRFASRPGPSACGSRGPSRGLTVDRGAAGPRRDDRRADPHRARPGAPGGAQTHKTKERSSDGRLRGGAT